MKQSVCQMRRLSFKSARIIPGFPAARIFQYRTLDVGLHGVKRKKNEKNVLGVQSVSIMLERPRARRLACVNGYERKYILIFINVPRESNIGRNERICGGSWKFLKLPRQRTERERERVPFLLGELRICKRIKEIVRKIKNVKNCVKIAI